MTPIKAAARPGRHGGGVMASMSFAERPFLVIWEVTRACALACRHCRAEAMPARHPLELDTPSALALIAQVAACQPQLFVLTGGDPLRRPDLNELIAAATGHGLRVALTPSATPELAAADFRGWRRLGVARIALSLDGADRASHDAFRGVAGVWDWTMAAVAKVREAGLPLQINTTFTRANLGAFDAFVELVRTLQPVLWSVFQLVPTGRARPADLLSGEEMETLFERLAQLSSRVPFDIKTTEGPHYRRVVLQLDDRARADALRQRAPLGINDGKGFVFISHTGEIYPSGFLPLRTGNARRDSLLAVYRTHPVFLQLRDVGQLQGKCGRCGFRSVCGGSRARAYALTGDWMAEEPLCTYQPGVRRHPASPGGARSPAQVLC